MSLLTHLKQQAQHLKTELVALYYVARDPSTPWYARLLIAAIVAYALSPIDLIPDFIPVLGYVDDLILLPLAIMLVIKLISADVLEKNRARARQSATHLQHRSWIAAIVIILIWLSLAILCGWWLSTYLKINAA